MDINPQNQTLNNPDQTPKNSKLTAIGAWMIIIGLALGGFSINKYFKTHPIKSQNDTPKEQLIVIEQILKEVIPDDGYEINAKWGDIGPNLIKSGTIDLEKFKELYLQDGGLKSNELAILENTSDSNIKITKENAHFVLNLLWAFGLAQQNKLLTEGDMIKYGDYKKFASTGGWTISAKPIEEFYSKYNWVNLDSKKEERIKNIAENVYRPCCNNSTAFPDCNHGMAALGLIEIMVAGNAPEDEIYEALRYFNSFWFSSSYLEMAIYFKQVKNKDWSEVDAKEILSKNYSSSGGWAKNIHKELEKTPEFLPKNPEGGGCGV